VLQFLALVGLSAVGTFVPGMPEGLSVGYSSKYHWNIWLIATGCAAGQSISFLVLYFFGEQVMRRWAWFSKQVYDVRVKFADHLEERFLILSALGGSVGVPPALAMAALGSGFGVPARHVIPVLFLTRILRFAVMTVIGGHLWDWVRSFF
jgi:membrane protein YqaA with SNARE-associated domain